VGGFVRAGHKVDVLLHMKKFSFQEKTGAVEVTGGGDSRDVRVEVEDQGGTVRLLQLVEVLAVDNRTEKSASDAKPEDKRQMEKSAVDAKLADQREQLSFVTLLVKPRQAQILAEAQMRGTLILVLRNPNDAIKLKENGEVKVSDDQKDSDVGPVTPDELTTRNRPNIRVVRGGH
jgi:Flp pilus assembly protein CpaB